MSGRNEEKYHYFLPDSSKIVIFAHEKTSHVNLIFMNDLLKRYSLLFLLLLFTTIVSVADDRQPMTMEDAKAMTATVAMGRVSVHDPSVVYDDQSRQYYIFGSHRASARTSNLRQWTAFTAPWRVPGISDNAANAEAFVCNQTTTVPIGGQDVAFGTYNVVAWSAAGSSNPSSYSIDGNMWAPDVLWNKAMQKWCMYLSINGDNWASSIILLTADAIGGPYTYEGPVVFSGFRNTTNAGISYKLTDMELVLGQQSSLPARYNQGNSWKLYWPNAIDPCVFYDEEGQLWMTYGSWFGGIWLLRLNEANGLRDYDVSYDSDYDSRRQQLTTDAYFGKRIAGGCNVSGEASYIEHIGDWYYLFVTHGGLAAAGGYQMRVYRSQSVEGPYLDPSGHTATYANYVLNYGTGGDRHGEKLFGAYGEWGGTAIGDNGETAQGHNSVIAASDGRTYLVYHTRFHNRGEEHEVRVHQVFQTQDGWLVAAPFEYTGETTTDADIATQVTFSADDLEGDYQMLVHRYNLNHATMEQATPVSVTLHADGTIDGAFSGTWQTDDGTSYITLTLDGVVYRGVTIEQQVDPTSAKAVCFTACSNTGENIWGYKYEDGYNLAQTLVNLKVPIYAGKRISSNQNLYNVATEPGVEVIWTSSHPEIISDEGHYNPAGLTTATDVTLTLRLQTRHYYYEKTYKVKAQPETMPNGDVATGRQAYYDFNVAPFANAMNTTQTARLLMAGSALAPVVESDHERLGNYVHQWFGINGNESYVEVDNPLFGRTDLDGFTVAFWCRRSDDNVWDALFGMSADSGARLYLTGNTYLGYNSNNGNWIDLNYPNDVTTDNLSVGEWHFVTLTVSPANGIHIYIDGSDKAFRAANGSLNGSSITNVDSFDASLLVSLAAQCRMLWLGKGSFWGSADACFDDLFVYDRALTATDAAALNTLVNRVYNFWPTDTAPTAIVMNEEQQDLSVPSSSQFSVYTLSGRRVTSAPAPGIYISHGKKIMLK